MIRKYAYITTIIFRGTQKIDFLTVNKYDENLEQAQNKYPS